MTAESRGQNLVPTTTADPGVLKLVEYARKAERYDTLTKLLQQISLLEDDMKRMRHSKSKTKLLSDVALTAKIDELKLMVAALIRS